MMGSQGTKIHVSGVIFQLVGDWLYVLKGNWTQWSPYWLGNKYGGKQIAAYKMSLPSKHPNSNSYDSSESLDR